MSKINSKLRMMEKLKTILNIFQLRLPKPITQIIFFQIGKPIQMLGLDSLQKLFSDSEPDSSTLSGAESESDEAEGILFMFLAEPSDRLSVSGSVRSLTELSVVP